MNTKTCIILAAALAMGGIGCGSSKPVAKPAPAPVETEVEAQVEEKPSPAAADITYHFRDGRTRAYLGLDGPICMRDDTAEPVYKLKALWKLDADANTWQPMDVAPDQPYRISCNAMLDLVNLLGYDLETGNYVVVAEIGGKTERDVFMVGEATCDDDPGPAPQGQIALCVLGPSSAETRLVPDPSTLSD